MKKEFRFIVIHNNNNMLLEMHLDRNSQEKVLFHHMIHQTKENTEALQIHLSSLNRIVGEEAREDK
jgi:hypothetical protein